MLPSSNCYNPFDHHMFKRQSNNFHYDQSPNPKQDDPSSFFTSFPSPIFDENELPLNQILSHHQPSSENHNTYNLSIDHQIISTQQDSSRSMNNVLMSNDHQKEAKNSKPNNKEINARVIRKNIGVVPRRRTGKKDRHSKIRTARGIRDRRMRLSLQVARKFFDLQDMLGYDKASKTIEWLFNKSKIAINELTKDSLPHNMCFSDNDGKSESLISECEVVSSGIEEHSNSDVKDVNGPITVELISVRDFSAAREETKKIVEKNDISKSNQSKGSREEARARARCRTREKMLIKGLDAYSIIRLKSNPNEKGNTNELSLNTAELVSPSSATFFDAADHQETINLVQERGGFMQLCDMHQSFEPEKLNDADTIEKLLGYTTSSSSSSSCPIADYQCFGAAVSGFSDPKAACGNYWDTFNDEKMINTIQYEDDTSQVSLAGNPNSVILLNRSEFLAISSEIKRVELKSVGQCL